MRLSMYLSAALIAVGFAACGSDDPTTPADGGTTRADASATGMDAAVLTGDATRGAAVFAANCAACHGVDGKGTVAVPAAKSFAAAEVQAKTDTALGDVIKNGQGGGTMPAFGTLLSAQQVIDLVAFIRTVR